MKKLTLLFFAFLMALPLWAAPTLTVSPQRLTFECYPGRTYYRTFTVYGENLTQNLTLTMFGDDFAFSMDKTTISVHEAFDGAVVKVYFKPQEVGEFGANIWITSGEVSQVVQLFGVGEEPPSITANPTSLHLNCEVDGLATATFTVTGSNLEEGIRLDLEGDPDHQAFSIDKVNIPFFDATGSSIVTVSYQPRQSGRDTATVTLSSHYANDLVITLYGRARNLLTFQNRILMGEVYDLTDEGSGGMALSEPSECGLSLSGMMSGNTLTLNEFDNLLSIDLDYDNMTATLYENSTQSTTSSGQDNTTTQTRYVLKCDETLGGQNAQPGIITGTIAEDGSIAFDGFIIETEKIVTVTYGLLNHVISTDTTSYSKLYRNVLLAEPNGVHRYDRPLEPDPGTAEPMLNFSIVGNAPVYIQQQENTVKVWNLYNMGGANTMVLDNGFFEWPWQQCNYSDDGINWYNYTYYRSTQPEGEPMISVVTYPHRYRGVKGKATEESLTWGQTTFGNGQGVWSSDVFIDNVLSYTGGQLFDCEETVWSIADVTRLIDGILLNDMEILLHPGSDVNEDGDVSIADVTSLIDLLLGNN